MVTMRLSKKALNGTSIGMIYGMGRRPLSMSQILVPRGSRMRSDSTTEKEKRLLGDWEDETLYP